MTTLTAPMATAQAEPKPSATEIQKKLNKLNEQVDQLVEKYNTLRGDLTAAKKKMTAATRAAKREEATFEQMREGIAQMAATAYKSGDMTDASTLLSSDDPRTVLDQVTVFTHLSDSRASQLSAYLAAAQRVQREKAQAKAAYDEVAAKAKALRQQKATVDKNIAKQKTLLRKAGGAPSSRRTGGTYTGPATGSARKALDFAHAQLGKPYGYGEEGPNRYDCSGLTMMAWRAGGVSLPRTTYTQWDATADKRVAYADLQPGDLVFFSNLGHMGMFVGNGKMIHAPHTGDVVKISDISSGYYRQRFQGGGRP